MPDGTYDSFGGDGVTILDPILSLRPIEVLSSGLTSGLVISAGEIVAVEAGSVLSAATVQSGGALEIISGGQDFGTTVESGGFSYVLSDGTANGTVIESGGSQIVSAGGTASGTIVGNGATVYVLAGADTPDMDFEGGTVELVPANTLIDYGLGGNLSGAIVSNGFTLDVASGGFASGTTIRSGGVENVYAGGVASGTTILGGALIVSSGGAATNVTFQGNGGVLSVDDPSEFSGLLANWQFGDTLDFRNLILSNVSIGGPVEIFTAGGFVEATTLEFSVGAQAYDYFLTGVPLGTTLTSQGDGSSGTDLGLNLVGAGESVSVSAGQTVADLLVEGVLGVMSGGVANTMTIGDGGVEVVSSGSMASGTIIDENGQLEVDRGGVARDSIVESGGLILGYGNVDGTVVTSGGAILLPWASGETVATLAADKGVTLDSGAILGIDIASGTTVSGLVITSDAFDQVEGSTVSTIVEAGGGERAVAGGTTSATMVQSGGTETVNSGGLAENAIIDGALVAFASGSALGTIVDTGGVVTLNSGFASDSTIENGGLEVIEGGIDSGALVQAGGKLQVAYGSAVAADVYGEVDLLNSGAQTIGAQIKSGGLEVVSLGGLAQNSIVESGGSLDLQGGAASAATVSNGGALLIEGGRANSAIVLDGGSATILSHGSASSSVVSAGGTLTVSSGGVAFATTILNGGLEIVSAGAFESGATISSGGELLVTSGGSVDGFPTTIAGGLLVLDAGALALGNVLEFTGSGGMLEIDGSVMPSAPIDGFRPNDTVDLADISFSKSGTAIFKGGNLLEIVEGGSTYDLRFAENLAGYRFLLAPDQNGGTDITAAAADYWRGPSSSNRSGDWNTAADWGNQYIPQSLDRVVLGGAGAYTVTNEINRKIASLAITDASATLDLTSGTLTLSGQSRNEGTIEVGSKGALVDDGGLVNDGTLVVNGGQSTVSGTFAGTGSATIAGGTLDLAGKVVATETVSFAATATGTLELGAAQKFAGTVAGFAQGDSIDLENFAFSQATIKRVSGNGAAGTDTIVTIKAGTMTANIALLNQYAGQFAVDPSDYTLSSDHRSGTAGTLFQLAAPIA